MKLTICSLLSIVVVIHAATLEKVAENKPSFELDLEIGGIELFEIELGKEDALIDIDILSGESGSLLDLEIGGNNGSLLDLEFLKNKQGDGLLELDITKSKQDIVQVDSGKNVDESERIKRNLLDMLKKKDDIDILGGKKVDPLLEHVIQKNNNGDDLLELDIAKRKRDLHQVDSGKYVDGSDRKKRGVLSLDVLGSGSKGSGSALVDIDILSNKRHNSLVDVDILASKDSSHSGQHHSVHDAHRAYHKAKHQAHHREHLQHHEHSHHHRYSKHQHHEGNGYEQQPQHGQLDFQASVQHHSQSGHDLNGQHQGGQSSGQDSSSSHVLEGGLYINKQIL